MPSSSSSAPAPKSPDIFVPPVEGKLFSKKLGRRLRRSVTDGHPLVRESAKNVLEAERLAVEALMIIHKLRASLPLGTRPKADEENVEALNLQPEVPVVAQQENEPADEAKVFQFPVSQQSQAPEGSKNEQSETDTEKQVGFHPIVYGASPSEEDDSGLDIITAGEEADEKVFEDFGFDENSGKPDEWDLLYQRLREIDILERIVKKTGAKDVHEMAEKLRKDPDFHVSKKGRGKGKGKKN